MQLRRRNETPDDRIDHLLVPEICIRPSLQAAQLGGSLASRLSITFSKLHLAGAVSYKEQDASM